MATYKTIRATLAAAVATAGTFAVTYPVGTAKADYTRGVKHRLRALGAEYVSPTSITVSLGTTTATVTYNGATTLPAGTNIVFQLDMGGADSYREAAAPLPGRVFGYDLVLVELGNPGTADADGIAASQSIATTATINGALASSGVVTFDFPRNVVGAWTTNAVVTVTGTDVNGDALVEACASGATFTGVKAFKTVTSVAASTAITLATFGSGDVLGLPFHLPTTSLVLKELENVAAATSGTLVAGLVQGTKSTSTTADVRGTYDPNSACDGSKAFALLVAVPDVHNQGNPQYAG